MILQFVPNKSGTPTLAVARVVVPSLGHIGLISGSDMSEFVTADVFSDEVFKGNFTVDLFLVLLRGKSCFYFISRPPVLIM